MGPIVLLAVYLAALVVGLAGWFMNLFAAAHLFIDNAPFNTLFLGRVLGVVFAPLGAFLGWY